MCARAREGGRCHCKSIKRCIYASTVIKKKSVYHLCIISVSIMLRMVVFIVVTKLNHTIFMPGYFYLVIPQIKLSQSKHDFTWFENACAKVTPVHNHMSKQLRGFNTLLPQSCLLSWSSGNHYTFFYVGPSQFTCWWIGANSPWLMGRSVKQTTP